MDSSTWLAITPKGEEEIQHRRHQLSIRKRSVLVSLEKPHTVEQILERTVFSEDEILDEINKQYVVTARAKGLSESRVLYGHVFRNAMLLIIAGFPAAFIGIFFTGSLLIEVIFSLDGLGLLGFESIVNRDYPVVFGTLFIFTLLGLVVKLIGDLTYTLVDPRIDFESREH